MQISHLLVLFLHHCCDWDGCRDWKQLSSTVGNSLLEFLSFGKVQFSLPRFSCHLMHFSVLYTPPPFPTDSNGLSPDPANSDGLSWTDSPSDFQWIPSDLTKFRCLSSPSPVKVQWNRKASDWPDWPVRWMSVGLLTVLEAENRQNVLSVKSDGLLTDFQWT